MFPTRYTIEDVRLLTETTYTTDTRTGEICGRYTERCMWYRQLKDISVTHPHRLKQKETLRTYTIIDTTITKSKKHKNNTKYGTIKHTRP